MKIETNVMYRYEDFRWAAPLDEWDNPVGKGRADIRCLEFPILKTTPKGVWINNYGPKRWVRLDAHKRFACPTKEEAMESFKARKKRQRSILKAQLSHLDEVDKIMEERDRSAGE